MPRKHCSCCRNGAPAEWLPAADAPYDTLILAYWANREWSEMMLLKRQLPKPRSYLDITPADRWEDNVEGLNHGPPTHFARLPAQPKLEK